MNDYLQAGSAPVSDEKGYIGTMLSKINPYAPPMFVSKGSIQTNLGGILTLYDETGGTKVFTYDPKTGVITVLGTLNVQNSSTGTYTNITLTGTTLLTGTIAGGVVNSTVGGTVNGTTYQVGGTQGVSGLGTYVKSIDWVGSTVTLGTFATTNGITTVFN
jgi:hypothetical protein